MNGLMGGWCRGGDGIGERKKKGSREEQERGRTKRGELIGSPPLTPSEMVNKRRKDPKFQIGDRVWVHRRRSPGHDSSIHSEGKDSNSSTSTRVLSSNTDGWASGTVRFFGVFHLPSLQTSQDASSSPGRPETVERKLEDGRKHLQQQQQQEQQGPVYLGVEWDVPGTGKHDGEVRGVRFFQTRRPLSGSFVDPRAAELGEELLGRILERYQFEEEEEGRNSLSLPRSSLI